MNTPGSAVRRIVADDRGGVGGLQIPVLFRVVVGAHANPEPRTITSALLV